jgi:hypothetical protein
MLVAMALVIFMMAIMSEAFVHGLEAFRRLKAIADMDSQLRNAVVLLRSDLARPHFGSEERLSDPNFYSDPTHRPQLGFFSYQEGELRPNSQTMARTSPYYEGTDQFGFPSFRAHKDVLHFTSRGERHKREGWYRTIVPPPVPPLLFPLDTLAPAPSRFDLTGPNNVYTSQWAELLWFLVPVPGQVSASDETVAGTPLQLFNLYRQQLLLVTETDPTNTDPLTRPSLRGHAGHQFPAFDVGTRPNPTATNPPTVVFTSPADIQFRQWRWGGRPVNPSTNPNNQAAWLPEAAYPYPFYPPSYPGNQSGPYLQFGNPTDATHQALSTNSPLRAATTSPNRTGQDLILTNVVSLDVKVWDPNAVINAQTGARRGMFVDLGHATPDTVVNRQAWGLAANEVINTVPANPAQTNPALPDSLLLGAFFYGPGDQPTLAHVDDNNLRAPTPYLLKTYDTMSFRDAVLFNPNTGLYNSQFVGSAGIYSADGFNPVHLAPNGVPKKIYPVPYRVRIEMIQVQVRVWDPKTKQTRQVTIVQDM